MSLTRWERRILVHLYSQDSVQTAGQIVDAIPWLTHRRFHRAVRRLELVDLIASEPTGIALGDPWCGGWEPELAYRLTSLGQLLIRLGVVR